VTLLPVEHARERTTLDLDTRFRERARAEDVMPSAGDDPHWNEVGHAWVAEALYEKLEPLLGP
jgi:hypothetical protein